MSNCTLPPVSSRRFAMKPLVNVAFVYFPASLLRPGTLKVILSSHTARMDGRSPLEKSAYIFSIKPTFGCIAPPTRSHLTEGAPCHARDSVISPIHGHLDRCARHFQ